MPYESHTCTALCRLYKVELNKSFFTYFFRNKSHIFTYEELNDKLKKEIHFILKETNIPGDIKGLNK